MRKENFYLTEEQVLKLGGYDPSECSLIFANFNESDKVKFGVALNDDWEKDEVWESVVVSKTKLDCLKLMTNDLLKAEQYLNEMGIETRQEDNDDRFRNMDDIINDIAEKYYKNLEI